MGRKLREKARENKERLLLETAQGNLAQIHVGSREVGRVVYHQVGVGN